MDLMDESLLEFWRVLNRHHVIVYHGWWVCSRYEWV